MNENTISDNRFVALQRTPKQVEWDNFRTRLAQKYERDSSFRSRFLESVRSIRAVSPGSVHQNQLLETMSVMYAPGKYIGERLMPVVPVNHRSNSYAIYPKREQFAAPDDRITDRARPNELSETRTTGNYSCEDYAFQDYVDATTIENEDPIFNELARIVTYPLQMLAFKREQRIAAIVRNAANYAGNTANAVSWLDETNVNSKPDVDIMTIIEKTFPGHAEDADLYGACAPEVANALLRHPRIRNLSMYVAAGYSPLRWIANQLGLADILVGTARQDTANPGSAETYSRIWGDDFAIVSVSQMPTRESAHFGTTFRMRNDPTTNRWYDPSVGKGGGYWGSAGISEDHKVVAGDTSGLITGCLS